MIYYLGVVLPTVLLAVGGTLILVGNSTRELRQRIEELEKLAREDGRIP